MEINMGKLVARVLFSFIPSDLKIKFSNGH